MEFITTNTKKTVKIVPATFKDASDLKKETMKCLNKSDVLKNIDVNNISNTNTKGIFDSLANLIISLDTSVEFENAVFKCLERCIYDDKFSITQQLFDDKPELREDYYEIVTKCCEVNLRPFFKSLSSELSTRLNQNSDTPQLKIQQAKN